MSDRTSSSRTVLQLDEYLLRRKRGFVRSQIEVVTPGGRVAGVWTKPRRLVRGFLAVVLAPTAFIGTMILGFWLFDALDQDPRQHSASQYPGFWSMLLGGAWTIMVIASPFVVMNWIHPANCLVLKDSRESGSRRLEVRSRMAMTLTSVRYTVLSEAGESLAVIPSGYLP